MTVFCSCWAGSAGGSVWRGWSEQSLEDQQGSIPSPIFVLA